MRFRGYQTILATGLFLSASAAHAAALHVAAAADLETVLSKALIPAFDKATGATVTTTYGSTQLLATQLENGAPFDVFLSADSATPQHLAAEGDLLPGSVHIYAVGQLVMWTRREAAHHPLRIQDLSSPVYAKIAVANPAVAPYGLAAEQSFAHAGITKTIALRLVTAENIGQCLAYARSGNADVALTALSLVVTDHRDPYVIVPGSLHAPINQSLGVVRGSKEGALAERFCAFLTGAAAAKIWKQFGYGLPQSVHPKK